MRTCARDCPIRRAVVAVPVAVSLAYQSVSVPPWPVCTYAVGASSPLAVSRRTALPAQEAVPKCDGVQRSIRLTANEVAAVAWVTVDGRRGSGLLVRGVAMPVAPPADVPTDEAAPPASCDVDSRCPAGGFDELCAGVTTLSRSDQLAAG